MNDTKKIAIVGSGLVGSLLSIFLKKYGHQVEVYDRRPDIRNIKFSGRSINLAMSHRGWNALKKAGIEQQVRKLGIPMDKRAIHLVGQEVYYQPYGKAGEAIFSISRGLFNQKMIDFAEERGVEFKFDTRIWDVDLPEAILYTGDSKWSPKTPLKFDHIFGADGAFSAVRNRMQRQSMFDYSQQFLKIGYKELTIPAGENGQHQLDKNSLHIWPRGHFMLIALPNLDGSFTCTLFLPIEGEHSFEKLENERELTVFFETYFPNTIPFIPNLIKDFFANPTSSLVTISCYPWVYWDKVALIGDAAHAIVPFYGQGMNAGFEDITELDKLLQKHPNNWAQVFSSYQISRKPNADAIAELSFRNLTEMSSKTADPDFILRKKIEKHLMEKFPDKWLPLYSMVTFSDIPYDQALREGDRQNKIMDAVMQLPNIHQIWESKTVEEFILNKLNQPLS
ncbi:MAG: kynurenine 3-monooxygenase [Bacteroidetes bacterium HGW-Bacteroidetes-13]|nr:MAG: kynurenine 3-monooxygenase [Bacteroidetes bacterium HGW-Bacteroidetes-13]